MNFISLFSGVGGIDLGLERAGMTCVGQVEINKFCNLVLEAHWPEIPRWLDVKKFLKRDYEFVYPKGRAPIVDLVCGGFPCTDVSTAGKGAGIHKGKKSRLWKEMFRIICEFKPRWVLVENVAALRAKGADYVLANLESQGYTCWPVVVGAWAVGAPHKRERVWIVGYASDLPGERISRGDVGTEKKVNSQGQQDGGVCLRSQLAGKADNGLAYAQPPPQRKQPQGIQTGQPQLGNAGTVADTDCSGGRQDKLQTELRTEGPVQSSRHSREIGITDKTPEVQRGNRWPSGRGVSQHEWEASRLIKLPLGGKFNGVSRRLVRLNNAFALAAYGNAVVPDVVQSIGEAIVKRDQELRDKARENQ